MRLNRRLAASMAALLAAIFWMGQDSLGLQLQEKPQRPSPPAKPAPPRTPQNAKPQEEEPLQWHDVKTLEIEGRAFDDTQSHFDRLPKAAQEMVPRPVWDLSHNSAGMAVRFVTDAPRLDAQWTLRNKNIAMTHMPATGVSGLDLYIRSGESWRWVASTRPGETQRQSATFFTKLKGGKREYLLYLPLYNGVTEVKLGVPKGTSLIKAQPRTAGFDKPIVFYGTSITQGGCASRPGMAYPAIVARKLDRPMVNLGFSGNGQMDLAIGTLMGRIDAALYFIDCLPNMNAKMVSERTEALVAEIRKARPKTPIVLVEDRTYPLALLQPGRQESQAANRAALRAAFDRLKAAGDENLHYIRGQGQLGADGEDTVDGSHPTDLGMMRMAEFFDPQLRKILSPQ